MYVFEMLSALGDVKDVLLAPPSFPPFSRAGRRNSNTFLHPLEKVQKTSQPEASMNEWLGRSVPISNLLLCSYIHIICTCMCVYVLYICFS